MVRHLVLRFTGSEAGATAVEYGLVAALIVVAVVGGVTAVGESAGDNIDSVAASFPKGS